MVDQSEPVAPSLAAPTEKPFALRSLLYTIGFLLIVLGVLPSVFFLVERKLTTDQPARFIIQQYWVLFRTAAGMSVFAAGLISYAACSAWLIFFGRGPHVEFDPPKVFVATGPYRWVRNPVVITLIVTAAGEAIYLWSIGIGAFVALGCIFAQYQVTKIEEPLLRKRFGETYDAYCRSVNRWIPKPPAA
ncbi:MAG TPA: isoprenylcysteine carboxylmethyltransferase family protein [Phycisphaerae bacterium]|nr:isoprenylcysteine carboxylmethyltransferase family protein [Phycisphaerae bacterium]